MGNGNDARGTRRWLAAIAALGLPVMVGAAAVVPAGAADATADRPPALVISHRGASAEAPEHTFAAYDRAVDEHTDVLECDLQLTADDVLVCMHDTTVDRTTGGTATGRVGDFTLEQLRAMDFGSWTGPEFAGAKIVPFEEQLRCYAKIDPGLQFEAETKAPGEYGGRMEPALIKLLTRLDLIPKGTADLARSKVIIQSFELPSLRDGEAARAVVADGLALRRAAGRGHRGRDPGLRGRAGAGGRVPAGGSRARRRRPTRRAGRSRRGRSTTPR